MKPERVRRVNEAVKAVLSEAIPELTDPRIGFVTVTGVSVTSDMQEATVFLSVLGSDRAQAATLEGLQSARGLLQARVGRELRLKRTPILSFEYDHSVERGVRLARLIDELAPADPESER